MSKKINFNYLLIFIIILTFVDPVYIYAQTPTYYNMGGLANSPTPTIYQGGQDGTPVPAAQDQPTSIPLPINQISPQAPPASGNTTPTPNWIPNVNCIPVTVNSANSVNEVMANRGKKRNRKGSNNTTNNQGLLQKLLALIQQLIQLLQQMSGGGGLPQDKSTVPSPAQNPDQQAPATKPNNPNPTNPQNPDGDRNPTTTLPPCPTETPSTEVPDMEQPQPSQGQAQPSTGAQPSSGAQPSVVAPSGVAGGTGGDIIPGVGTGGKFTAQYLSDVTGAGAFPDVSSGVTANCAGDGSTDDTSCLQSAMDQACASNVPLLIPGPKTYMISNSIKVCGSVIGTGSMPTIQQTSEDTNEGGVGLDLQSEMTGWIYNLHIIGMYKSGESPDGEWAQNIAVGPVNGVTIKGNILETPRGANIGDSAKGPAAKNVLVDNNTMLDPWECNVALVDQSDGWVMTNNKLDYSSGYVSPVDYEPWQESSSINNIEFAYNNVQCSAVGFGSCMQITAWFDQTPGGNIYTHHNYGSWVAPFPTDHGYQGSGVHFSNVVTENNVAGDAPPQ